MMRYLFQYIASIILLMNAITVYAATVNLTAAFTPRASNPNNNSFVNTTPQSGYCNRWPALCSGDNFSSVSLPLRTTMSHPIAANNPQREGVYFGLPKTNKVITVTNKESGESFNVIFRVSLFSATMSKGIDRDWLTYTGSTRTDTPMYPTDPGEGCSLGGTAVYTGTTFTFLWRALNNTTPCYLLSGIERESTPALFYEMSIGYELKAQSPLIMVGSGTYVGEIPFTVGPGGDFDFGDNYQANDSVLTVNLTVSVNHELLLTTSEADRQVAFQPCGTGKVCTQEQGIQNWERWMTTRITPELTSRSNFRLSSSGAFTVFMQCEHQQGNNCALKSGNNGQLVPFQAYITLPNHVVDKKTNTSVSRRSLSLDKDKSNNIFVSRTYGTNGAGNIDFQVKQNDVDTMLSTRPDTYRGMVTVIFDPNIF